MLSLDAELSPDTDLSLSYILPVLKNYFDPW
jgi:hypothetical protein